MQNDNVKLKVTKRRFWFWFNLLLLTAFLFAWSPWVREGFVTARLIAKANWESKYQQGLEPCSFLEIISFERVLFGAKVKAFYRCQVLEPRTELVKFVSFMGTVHSIRTVQK